VLTGGCQTVVRENIISSVNTGVGASLTENPQTQLYEARVGFIRSQFYSIPTGKNVDGKPVSKDEKGASTYTNLSNDVTNTPELVSGIRSETGIKHLFLGADVMENFAVGKVAVNSRAAVAMYIAQAAGEEQATAAAGALKADAELDELRKSLNSPTDNERRSKLDSWLKETGNVNYEGQQLGRREAAEGAAASVSDSKRTLTDIKLRGGAELESLLRRLQIQN
jgi:hypothetical protein